MSLINFLCRVQDEQCILKATELFKTIPPQYFLTTDDPQFNNTFVLFIKVSLIKLQNKTLTFLLFLSVHPNNRLLVYKYHMQNTNDFLEWLRLYEYYEITQDEREKDYAIESLSHTRQTWLLDL